MADVVRQYSISSDPAEHHHYVIGGRRPLIRKASNSRVTADQGIVEALACHGVHVETSCAAGLCGTCKLRYLSGTVAHHDFILSDEEHTEFLTACVSRATSAVLELDL